MWRIRIIWAVVGMLCFSSFGYGQIKDTIYVSLEKAAYLIFDGTTKVDVGAEESVVVTNPENKVIVKGMAEDFLETNIMVQCGEEYFMFIVRYDESPKKLFFNYQKAVRNKAVEQSVRLSADEGEMVDYAVKTKREAKLSEEDSVKSYYDEKAVKVLGESQDLSDRGAIKGNVKFILTNLYVIDDLFYFKIVVKNQSKIKYDIDFVRFEVKNVKKGVKKVAEQLVEKTPVYVYNGGVEFIEGKAKLERIYVFKKFTIDEKKKLVVEMWEKGGDRHIKFNVLSSDIFNVKMLR